MNMVFFFFIVLSDEPPPLLNPEFFARMFNTCFLISPYLPCNIFARALFSFLPIAVQSFLFTQKITTIIGARGFWILLTWFDPTTAASLPLSSPSATDATAAAGDLTNSMLRLSMAQGYSLFALMVIASGVLKLSALGWSISIERDWIVALCHFSSDALTRKHTPLTSIQYSTCTKPITQLRLTSSFDSDAY